MLLQEHNYDIYYNDEIEEEQSKFHQLADQRSSTVSVGFSDTSTCAKISPPSSFNNGLRRSTFDLSSFNSLATSSSSSTSSCYLPSPTRRSSTLRYRGSSSHQNDCFSVQEGAATRALLELAAKETTSPTIEEVREEPSTIVQFLDETQEAEDLFSPTAAATASTDDSPAIANSSTASSQHGDERSVMEFILEGILLGHLIVPLLHLIVTIERHVRSLFRGLQRNTGFLFASLFAPSSFQQEPNDADDEQLSSSLNLMQQELVVEDDDDDDYPGSEEACCCYSSSSSSSSDNDDNIESDAGGWGHFADFQDELADEKSFIPLCSASPLRTRSVVAAPPSPYQKGEVGACVASSLETLDECREEDDDTEEDWSF